MLATVEYDYKDNGRGPTITEVFRTGAGGLPIKWSIRGTTTFGSKIEDRFRQGDGRAEWMDSTGQGSATIRQPALYLPQNSSSSYQGGSVWQWQILGRALLGAPGMTLAVLPSGRLRLEKGESLAVQGTVGPVTMTRYDLNGIDIWPQMLLFDARGGWFADVTGPWQVIIRKGYETESEAGGVGRPVQRSPK